MNESFTLVRGCGRARWLHTPPGLTATLAYGAWIMATPTYTATPGGEPLRTPSRRGILASLGTAGTVSVVTSCTPVPAFMALDLRAGEDAVAAALVAAGEAGGGLDHPEVQAVIARQDALDAVLAGLCAAGLGGHRSEGRAPLLVYRRAWRWRLVRRRRCYCRRPCR
jgi:hypothetical protein